MSQKSGSQTDKGKAFEYACLKALFDKLSQNDDVTIEDSPQMKTAKKCYELQDDKIQNDLYAAAVAASKVVCRLEPQLENSQKNVPLYLCIQTDSEGIAGDVRDVVCIRRQNKWQIGLSCKHNHHAVKHSRLSGTIDFGKEWLGIPCDKSYFDKVVPIFGELRSIRDKSKDETPAKWEDIPDKAERYYKPILQAFMKELKRLADENAEVPERLIHYMLGVYDFYKVITDDRKRTTRVEAINISGTLNQPSGKIKSIVDVPKLKMPTKFYHIDFKEGSDNTVEVVCDEGWALSLRIHNASSRVEPSLKFDVQLISLPPALHSQVEPWEE